MLDGGCSGEVGGPPGLVEGRRGGDAVIGPEGGEVFEVADGVVVEVGGVAVGDAGEGGPQPRLAVLDRRGERVADGSGEQVGEESGVGSPGGGGEGAVDLLVLDDVGPVGDDPVPPGRLTVQGCLEQVGGVVEAELAAAELADGGAPVGGGAGEQPVELGPTFEQLGAAGDDGVGGVDAVGAREPGAGEPEPGLQRIPPCRQVRVGGSRPEPFGVVGELVAGPPVGDLVDGVVPGGGAGDVGGPVAEQPGEPAGPFGAERVGVPFDGTVDGSGVADGVAGFGAEAAHRGLPLLDAGGEVARDGVEALLGGVGQGARVAGVDEAQVGPVEGADGFAAVGGDELDGDPPGGVVEGGDGADVVPVGRADLAADPEVPGDVVDVGDPLGEVGAVEAVGVGGDPLRGHGDGEVGFEVGEGDGAGEAVDAVEVGVEAVGELLGVGAADALDQLVAGVAGFVVGGREPGVVAFQLRHGVVVELGGFGVGEHQPVLAPRRGTARRRRLRGRGRRRRRRWPGPRCRPGPGGW